MSLSRICPCCASAGSLQTLWHPPGNFADHCADCHIPPGPPPTDVFRHPSSHTSDAAPTTSDPPAIAPVVGHVRLAFIGAAILPARPLHFLPRLCLGQFVESTDRFTRASPHCRIRSNCQLANSLF